MANEDKIYIVPNPDNLPGDVTSGYQQQNTNICILQTGLDTTEPYDNGQGVITIPAGGMVEISGNICKITENITIQKPDPNRAYWLAIDLDDDEGRKVRPVTCPGTWNPAKQGFYTSDNIRTLKWVSLGSPDFGTLSQLYKKETKGTVTIQLPTGWYYAYMRSGKGGGQGMPGGNGTSINNSGRGGGGAGGIASDFFEESCFFFNKSGTAIEIKVGGNGYPGGNGGSGGAGYANGGSGGGGGGGGGGCGEATSLNIGKIIFTTLEVSCGNGGKGGNGASTQSSNASGGSGGGGGGGAIGGSGGKGGSGSAVYIQGVLVETNVGNSGGNGLSAVIKPMSFDGGNGESASASNRNPLGGMVGGYLSAMGISGGNGGSGRTGYANGGSGGAGGGGGAIGSHGRERPDGDTNAGLCTIYKISG